MTRFDVAIVSYRRFLARMSLSPVAPLGLKPSSGQSLALFLHCSGFILLTGVGMTGLSNTANAAPNPAQLRALFALLLFASVVLRGRWGYKALLQASADARREFDRCTNRAIYLLLYLLLGFQLILDLASDGIVHTDRCQSYVSCGLIALLLIRVISAVHWRAPSEKGQTQRTGSYTKPVRASFDQ